MRNWLLGAACFLLACNNSASTSTDAAAGSDSSANIQYAYSIDHPIDNWRPGDLNNIAVAMNALKAWENGDVAGSLNYFGDSVHFSTDDFDATVSKDSLMKMMSPYRSEISSLKITMHDCESVKSIDGKDEYVGLWYEQHWTDKAGKSYASYEMDDVKISNGKIVGLDTKSRRLPGSAK